MPEGNVRTYSSYGLLNKTKYRSARVCYEVSAASVVLSIVFVETLLVPLYFIGYDMYYPVRLKKDEKDSCSGVDD
jgi:hypothetical protein